MSRITSPSHKSKPHVSKSLGDTGLAVLNRKETELSRHCLGTVIVSDPSILLDVQGFSNALQVILSNEKVQCLGQVNHTFSNNSFTVVVGLAESHISVHTWPERATAQLDVFLCNYVNDNRQKCERIFNAIVEYFGAIEVEASFVDRR